MTKIKYAYMHPSFRDGDANKVNLTDWPFMSVPEQVRLVEWMLHVTNGGHHPGLNKPSWMFKGRELHSAAMYRSNDIWHYHCGPYTSPPRSSHRLTDNTLAENNAGRQSGEVYHYAKHQEAIVVIGYSRLHEPFPDPTSKSNPLRFRSSQSSRGLPNPKK
jgi:hypothetical protein